MTSYFERDTPTGAQEWLLSKAFGYADLPARDRSAINHFCLLWTLFENDVLNNRANATAIEAAIERLASAGRLRMAPLVHAFEYFKHRYFEDLEFTPDFEGLSFRASDRRQLVADVISGARDEPEEIATALLIIVLRLRNNLFHGLKWSYGIRNQRSNFEHSNRVLMSIMDMHGGSRRCGEKLYRFILPEARWSGGHSS